MNRPLEEPDCEGREPGIEAAVVFPTPEFRAEPAVRLWTVWDRYQCTLIEGLADS